MRVLESQTNKNLRVYLESCSATDNASSIDLMSDFCPNISWVSSSPTYMEFNGFRFSRMTESITFSCVINPCFTGTCKNTCSSSGFQNFHFTN